MFCSIYYFPISCLCTKGLFFFLNKTFVPSGYKQNIGVEIVFFFFFLIFLFKSSLWNFSWGLVVRTLRSMQEVRVRSLGQELRSHMSHGQKTKT